MTFSIGLERNICEEEEGVYESGVDTVGDCDGGQREVREEKCGLDAPWPDGSRSVSRDEESLAHAGAT